MSTPVWQTTTHSIGRVIPRAIAEPSDGVFLVGGYLQPPGSTLRERRGSLFTLRDQSLQEVWSEPGWAHCLACAPGVAYLIGAVLHPEGSGSLYRLFRSDDEGRSWASVGPVPAPSLTRLAAVNPDWLVALGAQTLLESSDGGRSWSPLTQPISVNSTRDHLTVSDGTLLLHGDGIHALRSPGGAWAHYAVERGSIGAVSGSGVAFWGPDASGIGAMTAEGFEALLEFEIPLRPFQLVLDRELIELLALTNDQNPPRILHYRSTDGGQSWHAATLDCRPDSAAVALGSYRSGLAVGPDGDLLSLRVEARPEYEFLISSP